jgi:hypothetical protein
MQLIEGIGLVTNNGFYNDPTVSFTNFCEGTLEQYNIISSTKDEKVPNLNQLSYSQIQVLILLQYNQNLI